MTNRYYPAEDDWPYRSQIHGPAFLLRDIAIPDCPVWLILMARKWQPTEQELWYWAGYAANAEGQDLSRVFDVVDEKFRRGRVDAVEEE